MYWTLPTQICNFMFCTPKNHGIQMQSKDQHLQISKWNSYSMLFKFLGWISHRIIWAHKHWFCPDDLSCYVGGTTQKFAVSRLAVPTIWPIQEGTNLTQKGATTLKEVGFSFDCLRRNNVQSLFGFQSSSSSNSHVLVVSCHNLVRSSNAS